MAATVFMCSSCGMCFDKMGLFTAHNCTGNKRKPIGIGTSVEEAEDVVLEMNTTPQERRRTMFECQNCKKVFYSIDIFANHVCVQAQPSIKEESTASSASTSEGQDQGQGMFWTRPATLLLIEEYKSRMDLLNSGKLRKKSMWDQISKVLSGKGHKMSGAQCEGRWKTLLRGLKNVHDHNKKSGRNPKYHPYDKELAFMAEKPNIAESYVVSSGSGNSKASKPIAASLTATDNQQNLTENESDAESENSSSSASKKVKKESTEYEPKPKRKRSNEVVEVLKNFMDTQQKRYDDECQRKEKMHNERMEIFGCFLELLKKGANDAKK